MNKLHLPDNAIILYFLALANAIGFAWASIAIEGTGGGWVSQILFGARGVLVGLAAGFGMASISNRLPRAAKAAKPWGYAGLAIIGLAAPVMMSPVIYSRMSGVSLSGLPLWVHVSVAIASGLLVDGLVLGIAATSGKLQDEQTVQAPAQPEKPTKKKPQSWQDFPYRCDPCRVGYEKQTSLAAHYGHAAVHKAQRPVEIDTTLLLRKGGDK